MVAWLAYAAFAAGGWALLLRDSDRDGIRNRSDTCPAVGEDSDGFRDDDGCPELDNDDDRIPDPVDTCPDEAEDRDGFRDTDGCPDPDNDADGILDPDDRCRHAAGTPAFAGCPDTDGDGTPDPDDACPHDPGAAGGCPEEAVAADAQEEIRIAEQIPFVTGRTALTPQSLQRLDAVARTLHTNPQVTRVEVRGHTDDVGPGDLNLQLSQDRAEAVVAYLVFRGIDPERLVARGCGETEPLTTNRTPRGRALNRRVQFVIGPNPEE